MIFGASTTRLFDLLQKQNLFGYSLQGKTAQRRVPTASELVDKSKIAKIKSQMNVQASKSSTLERASGVLSQAENSVSSLKTVVESLKGLAQQALDNGLSHSEREALETEAIELLKEFDKISQTAQFGTQNLFDGSFKPISLGSGLKVSLSKISSSKVGKITILQGGAKRIGPKDELSSVSNYSKINGVFLPTTTSDGKSSIYDKNSAIASANAINQIKDRTGVEAKVLANEQVVYLNLTGFIEVEDNIFSGNDLRINGVSIEGKLGNVPELINEINARSADTGVTAELGELNSILLRAEDGRNIEFAISNDSQNHSYKLFNSPLNRSFFGLGKDGGGGGEMGGNNTITDYLVTSASAAIELVSAKQIVIEGDYAMEQLGIKSGAYGPAADTSLSSLDLSSPEAATQALFFIESAENDIAKAESKLNSTQSRIDIRSASLLSSTERLNDYLENYKKSREAFEAVKESPKDLQEARRVSRAFGRSLSSLQVSSVLENLQKLFQNQS